MSDTTRHTGTSHSERGATVAGSESNITMRAGMVAEASIGVLTKPTLPDGILPFYLAKMSPMAAEAALKIGEAEADTAPAPKMVMANVDDPTSAGSPAHRELPPSPNPPAGRNRDRDQSHR